VEARCSALLFSKAIEKDAAMDMLKELVLPTPWLFLATSIAAVMSGSSLLSCLDISHSALHNRRIGQSLEPPLVHSLVANLLVRPINQKIAWLMSHTKHQINCFLHILISSKHL
jgi:ABC-type sulfate transport system permease component